MSKEPESDPPDEGRPSFELPLPPGMKPLEEPSRHRQDDPLRQPALEPPPALSLAPPLPVEPHELDLDALPGLDPSELPALELAEVPAPRPRASAAATAPTEPSPAPSGRLSLERALAFAQEHPLLILFVVLLVVAIGTSWEWTETWPEGLQLNDEPVQEPIAEPRVVAFAEYELIPKATYRLRARILGRERYRMGRESDLSSYDLALGWGVMSSQRVLDALDIRQGTRRYRYSWDGEEPAHPGTMARQSANHHIIAASDEVNEVLEDTPVGGALELEGELVVVEAPDGWRWETSLSRLDVGDGACEIFFVRRARRLRLAEL